MDEEHPTGEPWGSDARTEPAGPERFSVRQAVFVICRNEKGEVLLELRTATGYMDGCWDFPSGHVEANEGLREAAARELREETGLIAAPADLELVHLDQSLTDYAYVNYTFWAAAYQGEPVIMEPDKCSGLAWFPIDHLPARLTPTVRQNARAGFSRTLTYSRTDATHDTANHSS